MATLFHCPTFFFLPSPKLSLDHGRLQLTTKPLLNTQQQSSRSHFTLRASSLKKSRGKRKVKSNEELCDDIREFLSAVGFPEGHVPSTKELTQHGRSDLANIVRRRGYKVIRELLQNLPKTGIDERKTRENLDENQSTMSNVEDKLTGQNEKVNNVTEDISTTTEASIIINYSGGSDVDTDLNSDDHFTINLKYLASPDLDEKFSYTVKGHDEKGNSPSLEMSLPAEVSITGNCSGTVDIEGGPPWETDHNFVPVQSSTSPSLDEFKYNLDEQDEHTNKMAEGEDVSLSTEVLVMEKYSGNLSIDIDLDSANQNFSPVESSSDSPFEEVVLHNLERQVEKVNNRSEDISLSTVSEITNCSNNMNVDQDLKSPDSNKIPKESSISFSMKEKVANFIQNGYLDTIEDQNIFNESGYDESERVVESKNLREFKSIALGEEYSENVNSGGNTLTQDGSTLSSNEEAHPLSVNPSRDDHSLAGRPTVANSDKDVDVETVKKENLVEINQLKLMLHQKELELSRLKEQIEKEKLALSVLQNNVATEINKAQKLISEKDQELYAAEESLSGLEEVQIQYCGDGDIVEVAGSFNGWHHQIKMDPQPSTSMTEPIGARKSRLWSTVLWLYPGIYEVKFIVDGQWTIDPQRESVTGGTICNNILRVDR